MDAEEASAELRALLVEGGGGSGGLIEESVVGDGGIDLEARGGDDRLFAASDCGGRHFLGATGRGLGGHGL